MLCLTPENPSSNSTRTSRSAHQVEENLRRHGEEADRPKRFRGWRHHIEDDQCELSDPLDDQLWVSVRLVVVGQEVVAGRDPLLADHQDDDLEGLHEGCCLLGISWELGPELRSHRCSHIPCELHFCTSDQLTLSRGLLGIKAFFCYEDTPKCGTSATERNGVGRGASWALRPSLRFLRRPPARPRHHGWGRRPAPEHPQRPPRPFRRTVRPPGGSGAPTGRSGAPSEARKGPKSKIGPPAAPFKWEAWGARRRFRPLETVGTASNMHLMA